jgi:hypothetical protein
METIKLTDNQKKNLHKPNLYLQAVFSEGIEWNRWVESEEGYDYHETYGPTPSGPSGYDRKNELDPIFNDVGLEILNIMAENIINDSEDEVYANLDCYDCSGGGHIYVNYQPEDQTFTLLLDKYLTLTNEEYFSKTFNEWANVEPQYEWHRIPKDIKKLLDPDFIEKYKNEGENGIFEITYNGYGDSGEIETPVDLPDEIEYLGYAIIDVYFSGWENNSGADGEIIIDFNKQTISIRHDQRYEETERVELKKIQLV